MIISDLGYLEDISELPSVAGGIDVATNNTLSNAYFTFKYGGFASVDDIVAAKFLSLPIVGKSVSGTSVAVAASPGSTAYASATSGDASVEVSI